MYHRLFIGGPWDGRRVVLERDEAYFQVAVGDESETPIDFRDYKVNQPWPLYSIHPYCRSVLTFPVDKPFPNMKGVVFSVQQELVFMRHEKLSQFDAIYRLFTYYQPTGAVEERKNEVV